MDKSGTKTIAQNRKAYHDYFVEDRYEAGIELFGTEVKSIRALELDARLVAVFDKIVVERLAVLRRDFYPLFLRHGTSPPLRFHDSVAYFFAQHKGCHKNVTIRKSAAFRSILPIHFNL